MDDDYYELLVILLPKLLYINTPLSIPNGFETLST